MMMKIRAVVMLSIVMMMVGRWCEEADCCPLPTGQPQVNSPPAANITSHWIHIGIQAHTASMHVASHWNAGRSFIDTDIGK